MFEKIAEELHRAGLGLGREKLLASAPVYLFSVEKENWESPVFDLEQLLVQLEEQKLFSRQTDGLLCLSVEYGISEGTIGEALGFADESGRFKTSLERWLSDLNMQYQVEQGIVLLRVSRFREIFSEAVWQRRLFRQINRYKNDFLFLFQTEEKDIAAVREWLGGEYFCRRIQAGKWETADYVEFFKRGLERVNLSLDGQGESVLTELLERHADEMNSRRLRQWQQELVWEYFLSGESKEERRQIFPSSCMTEESFRKHLADRRMLSGIGFEVREHYIGERGKQI